MDTVSVEKNTGAILNTTPRGCELLVLALPHTAARAAVQRNEFALFHIELFVVHHFPFMKAARAQGFAFVLLGGCRFFKGQDVGHGG